jgi:hypothetical protein
LHIYSGILSGILSGICFDILSDILPGIYYSDILSGIDPDVFLAFYLAAVLSETAGKTQWGTRFQGFRWKTQSVTKWESGWETDKPETQ